MKSVDRNILIVVPVVAALAAFWFFVVSPKQNRAKQLDGEVSKLQSAVTSERQTVSNGIGARKAFPRDYFKLAVSGKAVPSQDETASLLVQVNRAADASGIIFKSISKGGGPAQGGVAAALAAAGGATTSPSGLGTQSYSLAFNGTFFQIANFISRMDRLVNPKGNMVAANGRLMTINDFTLSGGPELEADLSVTFYSTAPVSLGGSTSSTATPTSSTSSTPTSSASSTPTSSTNASSTSPAAGTGP